MSEQSRKNEMLRALMQRVAAGERSAWDGLLKELLLLVNSQVKASRLPPSEWEDAVAQICEWLVKELVTDCQQYDEARSQPVTYWKNILQHKIARFWHRETTEKRKMMQLSRQDPLQDGAMELAESPSQETLDWQRRESTHPATLRRLEAAQSVNIIRSALRTGSELDRELFEQYFVQEKEASEVMQQLQLKPDAFYQRVKRLKDKLKKLLAELGAISVVMLVVLAALEWWLCFG